MGICLKTATLNPELNPKPLPGNSILRTCALEKRYHKELLFQGHQVFLEWILAVLILDCGGILRSLRLPLGEALLSFAQETLWEVRGRGCMGRILGVGAAIYI